MSNQQTRAGQTQESVSPAHGRMCKPAGELAVTEAEVADGVRRSYAAFHDALPVLLHDGAHRGEWVAYHGEDLVGFDRTETALYERCLSLGFPRNSFYVGWVMQSAPVTIEAIDPSLFEFE